MGGVTRIENIFVKVIFGWGLLAAMFTSVPNLNVNVFVGANSNDLGQGGSSTVGEVNISAILNSFQMGYDKRVRPNYGGKFSIHLSPIYFSPMLHSGSNRNRVPHFENKSCSCQALLKQDTIFANVR
jgi:hypothetical protein